MGSRRRARGKSVEVQMSPEEFSSVFWNLPCPSCGAKTTVTSGPHQRKYVVCQSCVRFIRIDVPESITQTPNVVRVTDGGRAPRQFVPLVLAASMLAGLVTGFTWGLGAGIATFLCACVVGAILAVFYTTVTGD